MIAVLLSAVFYQILHFRFVWALFAVIAVLAMETQCVETQCVETQ